MNQDHFWRIIAAARLDESSQTDGWSQRLEAELINCPPDEIIEWNHIFDRLAARAYTAGLIAACCLINTGAGVDGFYYFRCWLIGMGRQIYEAAIVDPDSLADVVRPWVDAEAEIYGAAHQAWMEVTGEPDTAEYPARNEAAELTGEDWDIDDPTELRQRLPRLIDLYAEP